ncbi:MAG TPA: hypothetical protein PK636_02315, partial [bacterium]|nr:hypothetical protein [bacterium]
MRVVYGMGFFLLALPGWARIQSADPARAARDRLEMVRVEEVALPSGAVLEAWYRPERREGYTWIEARVDEAGRYLPGYWEPKETEIRYGG